MAGPLEAILVIFGRRSLIFLFQSSRETVLENSA